MQQLTLSHQDLSLQWQAFAGPLDLLLHLIRKRDLDIFDLPIHQLAEEFQSYVEQIQRIDLESAGDYLEMAAELTQIKSRMLLPVVQESKEDPRKELVEKVMEYEQVKQLTLHLKGRDLLGRDVFLRGADISDEIPDLPPTTDVTAGELIDIFSALLRRKLNGSPLHVHAVRRDTVSVRQQILWVCRSLRQQSSKALSFSEMMADIWDRPTFVVTFLALLELCRLHHIRLAQTEDCDILIEALTDLDEIPLDDPSSFTYRPLPADAPMLLSEEAEMLEDADDLLGSEEAESDFFDEETGIPQDEGDV